MKFPRLDSTDEELREIYKEQSDGFLRFFERDGATVSANSARDIAMLAHNELVKRSNDRYSKLSKRLTYLVVVLSIVTLVFATLDFLGDKDWQKKQLDQLEILNLNVSNLNNSMDSTRTRVGIIIRDVDILNRQTADIRMKLNNDSVIATFH